MRAACYEEMALGHSQSAALWVPSQALEINGAAELAKLRMAQTVLALFVYFKHSLGS